MTVSKDYNKHIYEGNGLTVAWPFDFELPSLAGGLDTSVIRVFLTDGAGEVGEITGGFTVDTGTGTVTYPLSGPPLASGEKITILRELPVSQQFFDPSNQSNLYPETLEDSTDRLVMMVQQVKEDVQRAIKLPVDREGTPEEVDPLLILDARDEAVSAASSAGISRDSAQAAMLGAQSARDGAVAAVEGAVADAVAATAADALAALGAAGDAAGSAAAASAAESMAGQYAAIAFAASAPPWDAGETYNYPDVVAYTDGMSYRCKGVGVTGVAPPSDTDLWTAVTVTGGDFFEIDDDGAYMPAAYPSYGDQFELDGNGDIMPVAI